MDRERERKRDRASAHVFLGSVSRVLQGFQLKLNWSVQTNKRVLINTIEVFSKVLINSLWVLIKWSIRESLWDTGETVGHRHCWNGHIRNLDLLVNLVVVQLLNCVQLFAIPWPAASGFPAFHRLLEFAQTHVH